METDNKKTEIVSSIKASLQSLFKTVATSALLVFLESWTLALLWNSAFETKLTQWQVAVVIIACRIILNGIKIK